MSCPLSFCCSVVFGCLSLSAVFCAVLSAVFFPTRPLSAALFPVKARLCAFQNITKSHLRKKCRFVTFSAGQSVTNCALPCCRLVTICRCIFPKTAGVLLSVCLWVVGWSWLGSRDPCRHYRGQNLCRILLPGMCAAIGSL